MVSSKKQAAEILRKQKAHRKWVVVFSCMAVLVAIGTTVALRMNGRAMNKTELHCVLAEQPVHHHTAECYDKPEGEPDRKLICGLADFLVHEHDEKTCYNSDGVLVCPLEEIKEHKHDDSCYKTEEVLVCGLEESAGHQHTEECWQETLICPLEEEAGHTHEEACYDENGELICGLEESEGHTHTEDCYERTLICGKEEGEGAHTHTAECRREEKTVICGKREAIVHKHTDKCYLDKDGNAATDENGKPMLTCGLLQTEKHVHDDKCFVTVTGSDEEQEPSSSSAASEVPEEPGVLTAVYADETVKVTASYPVGDAVPEDAKLTVERILSEEEIAQRQSALPQDGYSLQALFRVGYTVGGESASLESSVSLQAEFFGEEMTQQPNDFAATAFYQDGEGTEIAEQLDITVSQNVVSFSLSDVATVAVASKPGEAADEENNEENGQFVSQQTVLNLSNSFSYDEDPLFHMVFHVEGRAVLNRLVPVEPDPETSTKGSSEVFSEPSSEVTSQVSPEASSESMPVVSSEPAPEASQLTVSEPAPEAAPEAASEPVSETSSQVASETISEPVPETSSGLSSETAPETAGPSEPAEPSSEEILSANGSLDDPAQPFAFLVNYVNESDPAYTPYANYISLRDQEEGLDGEQNREGAGEGETENAESGEITVANPALQLPRLQVMSYTLYYEGVELDLTDCKVTVEITPTSRMNEIAGEIEAEAASLSGKIDQTASAPEGGEETEPSNETDEDWLPAEQADEKAGVIVTALSLTSPDEAQADEIVIYKDSAAQAEAESEAVQPTEQDALLEVDHQLAETGGETSKEETSNGEAVGEVISGEPVEDGSPTVYAAAAIQVGSESAPSMTMLVKAAGMRSATLGITTSTHVNPSFTVQYYAVLPITKISGAGTLKALDTRNGGNNQGGRKPQNGTGSLALTAGMSLNSDGSITTESQLHQLYTNLECSYFERPNLKYFNAMINTTDVAYVLRQVWVLKDGRNADSTSTGDWEIYGETFNNVTPRYQINTPAENLHFTNRSESQTNNTIYLKTGAVLRLVYSTNNNVNFSAATDFFDYDVNEADFHGKTSGTMYTMTGTSNVGSAQNPIPVENRGQGVNNPNNYDSPASTSRYAFGNANVGNGLSLLTWNGNKLNQTNRDNGTYQGCTFGLASSSDLNGNLTFSSGVSAPRSLFNSEAMTGKSGYNGTLTFRRDGDVYTLTVAGVNDTAKGVSNLDKLSHPQSKYPNIWTNHFWPMDSASKSKDMEFGVGASNQLRNKDPYTTYTSDDKLPTSDDGKNHNNYFGMHFYLTFDLSKEYVGPLDYYFFGDDDMWVFLTETNENYTKMNSQDLVCDIGGVHSSVGEAVDLWDYIQKQGRTETKHYRLDFYYTERGASGSTCWMQFVLPSVRGGDTNSHLTESDYGDLEIKKTVSKITVSSDGKEEKPVAFDTGEEFVFRLTLTDKNGKPLADDYSYTRYDRQNNEVKNLLDKDTVCNGETLLLKAGERILVRYLPVGTKYTIEELDLVTAGPPTESGGSITIPTKKPGNLYTTEVTWENGNETSQDPNNPKIISGTIAANKGGKYQIVTYDNRVRFFALPKTGGEGIYLYVGAGAMLVLLFCAGAYFRRRKRT